MTPLDDGPPPGADEPIDRTDLDILAGLRELYQAADPIPELGGNRRKRDAAVLDNVVQQRGGDRLCVGRHPLQEDGDFNGMNDVRLARFAELAVVQLNGPLQGALDNIGQIGALSCVAGGCSQS